MSKGDVQRPLSISQKEFDKKWEETFGKGPCGKCGAEVPRELCGKPCLKCGYKYPHGDCGD
jgi:hypothetical protein